MHRLIKSLFTSLILASPASADGTAGDFDYYVLSLSWSPTWCALEGDGRDDPQCDAGLGLAFTLHGLWPQYEQGWPSDCFTPARDPSRAETAAMADIMGSGGLAWYEWKKHGRCSGLSPSDYFAAARQAYRAVIVPDVLQELDRDILIPPPILERALLQANPALQADMLTITCKSGHMQEIRLCLTRDLQPRACAADVVTDCRDRTMLMQAVR
jgi:ribonuclease T2